MKQAVASLLLPHAPRAPSHNHARLHFIFRLPIQVPIFDTSSSRRQIDVSPFDGMSLSLQRTRRCTCCMRDGKPSTRNTTRARATAHKVPPARYVPTVGTHSYFCDQFTAAYAPCGTGGYYCVCCSAAAVVAPSNSSIPPSQALCARGVVGTRPHGARPCVMRNRPNEQTAVLRPVMLAQDYRCQLRVGGWSRSDATTRTLSATAPLAYMEDTAARSSVRVWRHETPANTRVLPVCWLGKARASAPEVRALLGALCGLSPPSTQHTCQAPCCATIGCASRQRATCARGQPEHSGWCTRSCSHLLWLVLWGKHPLGAAHADARAGTAGTRAASHSSAPARAAGSHPRRSHGASPPLANLWGGTRSRRLCPRGRSPTSCCGQDVPASSPASRPQP